MSTPLPPLALLAGGLAMRLHPITETLAKSMVDVAGEPFIAHQLRWLKKQNIRDIVICTGFLGETIEAFVGNGERFGLRVRYSPDGLAPVGTGGAIRQALPLLGEAFFVMYGDSFLPIDFQPVYDAFKRATNAQALMTVFGNEGKWDTSNVVFENDKILCYDKKNRTPAMRHIDYGLGIFTPAAFEGWSGAFDLAEIYAQLQKRGTLAGFEVTERFYEIGSHQGLNEMRALFSGSSNPA